MTHQPISSCNHLNIILTCKTSFIGNNFKYQLQNLWLNSGMPTAKTIHTPGCFYNMWTEGMVQKLKLFSLMTTLRAYLSFEGGEHLWIIISRPLMLCPFAAQLSSLKHQNFTGKFRCLSEEYLKYSVFSCREQYLRTCKKNEIAMTVWKSCEFARGAQYKPGPFSITLAVMCGRKERGFWATTPQCSSFPSPLPAAKTVRG